MEIRRLAGHGWLTASGDIVLDSAWDHQVLSPAAVAREVSNNPEGLRIVYKGRVFHVFGVEMPGANERSIAFANCDCAVAPTRTRVDDSWGISDRVSGDSLRRTPVSDLVAETRPFAVACDWCGTELVGQIRREHAGRMFVVQVPHVNRKGTRCLGSGRGIPVWPLRLELRAVGRGYELIIGDGNPIECASQEILEAALRGFGVMGDGAKRRVAGVDSETSVVFEVPERRRQPRSSG